MLATVFLTGKYAPGGYDWQIGKVIARDAFGVTVEDSRGNQSTYPVHAIQRLEKRNGW
jgi:hypothetical protein